VAIAIYGVCVCVCMCACFRSWAIATDAVCMFACFRKLNAMQRYLKLRRKIMHYRTRNVT